MSRTAAKSIRNRETEPISVDRLAAALKGAVARVRAMSQEERIESLKAAGILTQSGRLSSVYRQP